MRRRCAVLWRRSPVLEVSRDPLRAATAPRPTPGLTLDVCPKILQNARRIRSFHSSVWSQSTALRRRPQAPPRAVTTVNNGGAASGANGPQGQAWHCVGVDPAQRGGEAIHARGSGRPPLSINPLTFIPEYCKMRGPSAYSHRSGKPKRLAAGAWPHRIYGDLRWRRAGGDGPQGQVSR